MYQINIYNNQKAVALRINPAPFKHVLKYILRKERQSSGVFNFIFVDNQEIRRLNRRYLGRNSITDVIAFPLADNRDNIKGEVVISAEEARRQSRRRNIPLNNEIALYCIHGLLHLVGYDDLAKSKRVKMERRQSDYLKMMAAVLRHSVASEQRRMAAVLRHSVASEQRRMAISSVPRAGRRGFRRCSS